MQGVCCWSRSSGSAHVSVRKAPSDKGLEAYRFWTSSPRLCWGKLFWKYYLSTLPRTGTEHLLSHGPLRRGYIRELMTHTSIAASQSNWCTNFLHLHRQIQLKNLTYTWAIIQRNVEIDQGASSYGLTSKMYDKGDSAQREAHDFLGFLFCFLKSQHD